MKPARILSILVVLSLLALASAPVAAFMASPQDSGVSRGDYDTMKIFEAKSTYGKSEGSQYVTPWVSIVPGSQSIKQCNRYADYRYILISPDGTNYDKAVTDPSGKYMYKNADGALLSANGFFFTNDNKAAKWLKVSSLINNAEKNGFSWQGTWKIDYYFGNFDCDNKGSYEKTKSLSFTLVDDSAPTTTTPSYGTGKVTPQATPYATQPPATQQQVQRTYATESPSYPPATSASYVPSPSPRTTQAGLETSLAVIAVGLAGICLAFRKE